MVARQRGVIGGNLSCLCHKGRLHVQPGVSNQSQPASVPWEPLMAKARTKSVWNYPQPLNHSKYTKMKHTPCVFYLNSDFKNSNRNRNKLIQFSFRHTKKCICFYNIYVMPRLIVVLVNTYTCIIGLLVLLFYKENSKYRKAVCNYLENKFYISSQTKVCRIGKICMFTCWMFP